MDRIDKNFEKIEERLRKSFIGIKEDMDSIKSEISSLKNKKENVKIEKNVLDLTDYVSELKNEVKELKKTKVKERPESDVKNIIEFNGLRSEISDLKELIENIKIPAQKDYSKELNSLNERIENFEDLVEETKKSIKSIKIPSSKDYSEDINDLAKEIGELKGSIVSRKYLNRENEKIEEKLLDKISELEKKHEVLERSVEERARSPIVFSLKRELNQLKLQIEDEQEKSYKSLEEIKNENKKIRVDLERQNNELRQEMINLKSRLTRLGGKEKPVEVVEREPFRFPKLNKNFLFLSISIILVILIIGGIIFFVQPTVKAKYEPLDVVISNSTGLLMNVYLHQLKIDFTLSGWESKLNYNGKEDRVAGNNVTGWSFNSIVNIDENKISGKKFVSAELIPNKGSIDNMVFNYAFFKNKPYFNVKFLANTENNLKLGDMAYGINAKGYDVYLQNGTILDNDNKITTINGMDIRQGSTYINNNSNYEIFYNQNTSIAVVTYSVDTVQFKNSFYWNVYWVYVSGNNGIYAPLYFIVLEDTKLDFIDGKWQVQSKYYSGELEKYIYSSVSEMDNETSN